MAERTDGDVRIRLFYYEREKWYSHVATRFSTSVRESTAVMTGCSSDVEQGIGMQREFDIDVKTFRHCKITRSVRSPR